MSTVLVTGGSGFIGAHCIAQLLGAGYQVRTTIRSQQRESEVMAMLKRAGVDPGARLKFAIADLLNDAGWLEAVAGCEYVLHVASPFPAKVPKDENELIAPAREGTLRVLSAAKRAGVRRVVVTSSFAAIGYGHPDNSGPFTEKDWTDVNGHGVMPYAKSKTLAERAAWNYVEGEGKGLELAVVNPVGVFGPVLGADYSTSILLVQKMMDGALPGLPRMAFGVVDVRDVVDLHLRAMTHPDANGQRFLAVSGDFMWITEIARALKERLGAAARLVPTRELPNWFLRIASFAEPSVKQIIPELGKWKTASNEKARRVLGWMPRTREEAVVATAESLLHLGLLKESPTPARRG